MKIELQSVDASSNEADLRAKMYAIRSLADVVLADEVKDEQTKSSVQPEPKQSSSKTSDISPIEAKMMGIEQPSKSSEPTWHESDANGESIFDF
ncbi:hypothetical protein FHR85_001291 [Alkalibacillus almallahensis]|nr:hypothetical protein [Alkalibacillus almallahensis]